MLVGILTRNENSWSSTQLLEALARRNILHICFRFPQLIARVGYEPYVNAGSIRISEKLDALIVRPIGRGSLEEIVLRMDILYHLERLGLFVINPPQAIEHCVDKYAVLAILEDNGLPVPRTAVTENVGEALKAFHELGNDIIVKPIFGSRGIGSTRVTNPEVAATIFKAITFYHGVVYLQEFVPHGFSDIRAFVIGNRVVASMKRVANTWKTNYSQGAKPVSIKLDTRLEKMVLKSASLVGCRIAGVDILESSRGPLFVEVNSQPGWKGLQSVTTVNIAEEIVSFILSELRK